jgi:hypothetical protein
LSAKLTIMALAMLLPVPALAAGDEPWPLGYSLLMFAVMSLLIGLPTVGLGFFLQGFLRLRTAVVLLVVLAGLGSVLLEPAHSYGRALHLAIYLVATMLILSPLFGLGWYLGVKDTRRRIGRRKLA